MRIILITGGSRGIGAGAALECASRGFGVVLTYKTNPEAAAAVVRRIEDAGGSAAALPLDVADSAGFGAFRAALQETLHARWGTKRLHGLVNNAGYGVFEAMETVTEAQFDGLMNVHLKGPFFLTQALLPLLADGGAIVNLTSATTRVAFAGVAPYAAFKGGLEVLTRYMAKEFGARGIRANAVSPGPIRTELGGGLTPAFEQLLADQTALGRVGEADEVGRTIAMLLSDDASWINGQSVEVAGGYHL
jgi:NAD(P)-dependent dehydrogenase (short-subunit alcohol dehydrogenase family)